MWDKVMRNYATFVDILIRFAIFLVTLNEKGFEVHRGRLQSPLSSFQTIQRQGIDDSGPIFVLGFCDEKDS